MRNPEVNELQAAYIRKAVDTVNELDNVLYEVINEGGEQEWNRWVINTISSPQVARTRSPRRSWRTQRFILKRLKRNETWSSL